ncbi:MAG: hypothetical protein ACR2QF_00430 [Geminicoccaceae bacterium]
MSENTTTIEINGAKFEVDMRHAKRVDELRVGDRVKVLNKQYSGYSSHHGVIIGFDAFKELPTIIVAYLELSFSEAKVKFLYYNAKSEDVELVKAIDDDSGDLEKNNVMALLDKEIAKKEAEIKELERQRDYFLTNFRSYWQPIDSTASTDS